MDVVHDLARFVPQDADDLTLGSRFEAGDPIRETQH